MRDDSLLDQGPGGGSDENAHVLRESEYLLRVGSARLPNGWDVKCEQKSEVKNDPNVLV